MICEHVGNNPRSFPKCAPVSMKYAFHEHCVRVPEVTYTFIHTCLCLARRAFQSFMMRTKQDILDYIGTGGYGDAGRRTSNRFLIPFRQTERRRMEFEDKNEPSMRRDETRRDEGLFMQNGKRCGSRIRAVKTGGARRKGVRWTEARERRLGQGSGQMTVTNFRRSAKGKDEAVKDHQPPSFIGCMCHPTSHFSCVLNTYNMTYMRVDVTLSPTIFATA